MINTRLILYILAIVCELLAVFGFPSHFNLVALGLALFMLAGIA